MKNTLLILFILSISCTKPKENINSTKVVDDSLKQSITNELDGYWLSDSYLVEVANSRSIYLSRNYTTRLWGFRLEKANLLSNSPMLIGFTEHEGGYDIPIRFDPISNFFIANDFSYIREPFRLVQVDTNHLALDFDNKKEVYRKILDERTELRKVLFEGQFKSLPNDSIIEFKSDGTIKGIDGYRYFEPIYDFTEGINYDAMAFYPSKDSAGIWMRGKLFHFQIKADTLELYNIHSDWDEMEHKIGEIEYKLIKL
ncbi:hypothetical protein [Chryseosolibacter indicus]|uniref:DUF4292 domain-containing protein n=1 Tax=Chryseosolibacter indicus TaxID=2782351 RepID=A0ABS5VQI1_9BACT|nr:hypothetical protein [Chryseosolibacter indicus]MBT1703406.1 hypothetical protein [Chryseosolibacter indicus]